MKRILSVFVALFLTTPFVALGAVNVTHSGVKKADAVKKQDAAPIDSATSLLPTVIGLVQDVKNMNVKQQQLTADCAPTGEEVRLVNDLIKEWAKIGDTDAESAVLGLGVPCSRYTDDELRKETEDGKFQNYMQDAVDKNETCYERFTGKNNENTIWFKFPKASSAKICDINNPKNCKNISNIYEVFGKVSFGVEDYTKSEASKIAKFIEKSQKCAPAKIRSAKRELWGGFLTQTLGNLGKSNGVSGTEAVIQTVSSAGGGGLQSMLPSLGSIATQILDK